MKKLSLFLILSSFIFVLLIGCTKPTPVSEPALAPEPAQSTEQEYEIKTSPSGEKYIVDPEKLMGGGPPKDGIPSIDNPQFVSIDEADQWIEDNELVLAIIYKGVKRVYPLQIMVWHEIVNDIIAGDPILISY